MPSRRLRWAESQNLFAALPWTTAGFVVGALALYCADALLSRDRTVALAGRLPLVKASDIESFQSGPRTGDGGTVSNGQGPRAVERGVY